MKTNETQFFSEMRREIVPNSKVLSKKRKKSPGLTVKGEPKLMVFDPVIIFLQLLSMCRKNE